MKPTALIYIGLRLQLPAGIPEFGFDEKNLIGIVLLNKLIMAELALDGVTAGGGCFGTFTDLNGVIGVDGLSPALGIIGRIFADLGFRDHNAPRLAWYDDAEGTWRLHPYGDASEFNQAFGRDDKAVRKMIHAARKSLQL